MARRPQEHEAQFEGAATVDPFVTQTARPLAGKHGSKMRTRTAGMQVLVESGKGTAKRAYLSVAKFLPSQPLDGVESILVFAPGLVAERIPQSFRGVPPPGILNRHHIPVRGQELGSSDAHHHRLVLSVWRTL